MISLNSALENGFLAFVFHSILADLIAPPQVHDSACIPVESYSIHVRPFLQQSRSL